MFKWKELNLELDPFYLKGKEIIDDYKILKRRKNAKKSGINQSFFDFERIEYQNLNNIFEKNWFSRVLSSPSSEDQAKDKDYEPSEKFSFQKLILYIIIFDFSSENESENEFPKTFDRKSETLQTEM